MPKQRILAEAFPERVAALWDRTVSGNTDPATVGVSSLELLLLALPEGRV